MSPPSDWAPVAIRPFGAGDWAALWAVRFAQLAEAGIVLADTTPPGRSRAVPEDDPEWDFHHIEQVYLGGMGNFWLARAGEQPIGYVGAQDVGGAIELRRMYVRAAYRRHGVGTALVGALLAYCAAQGAPAIELWTAGEGLGSHLYRRLGFRWVEGPGCEFQGGGARTGRAPRAEERRMRRDLP
jgi:GNAT superfamily N-acetyltransferase